MVVVASLELLLTCSSQDFWRTWAQGPTSVTASLPALPGQLCAVIDPQDASYGLKMPGVAVAGSAVLEAVGNYGWPEPPLVVGSKRQAGHPPTSGSPGFEDTATVITHPLGTPRFDRSGRVLGAFRRG